MEDCFCRAYCFHRYECRFTTCSIKSGVSYVVVMYDHGLDGVREYRSVTWRARGHVQVRGSENVGTTSEWAGQRANPTKPAAAPTPRPSSLAPPLLRLRTCIIAAYHALPLSSASMAVVARLRPPATAARSRRHWPDRLVSFLGLPSVPRRWPTRLDKYREGACDAR